MKKLMIAVAVVCVAALSQAATVTWKTDAMYWNGADKSASSDKGTLLASESVYGYLYNINLGTYNTILASILEDGALNNANMVKVAQDALAGDYGTAAKGPQKASSGGIVQLKDGNDYEGTGLNYALLVYTTVQDGKTYYIANVAQADVALSNVTVIELNKTVGGDSTAATAGIVWATEAVPEPTSGLLLLLGVAGLALRRRCA